MDHGLSQAALPALANDILHYSEAPETITTVAHVEMEGCLMKQEVKYGQRRPRILDSMDLTWIVSGETF
jgi:hypothetical protein